jgi:hypothetical protein
MDCAAISIEAQANNAKLQSLGGEQSNKVAQNVAAGVAGLFIWPLWFAMDFQGSADKEEAAINSRNQYLAVMAQQRHCGVVLPRSPLPPCLHNHIEAHEMFRKLLLAAGLALALAVPSYAADPQKFGDEAKATAFCKAGNVVWFNPDSKIYFAPGSQFYGKTKNGGFTCRAFADKSGFRASKGN